MKNVKLAEYLLLHTLSYVKTCFKHFMVFDVLDNYILRFFKDRVIFINHKLYVINTSSRYAKNIRSVIFLTNARPRQFLIYRQQPCRRSTPARALGRAAKVQRIFSPREEADLSSCCNTSLPYLPTYLPPSRKHCII